jgi:hypothetical protein
LQQKEEKDITSALDSIKNSLKSYSSLLSWFFFDSIWKSKWQSFFVLGTGFLGVAFQAQVFGLIIYYARKFSSGELIELVGFSFDPRTSVGLLASGSATVVVLLSLSALCIYFSRQSILRMGRNYEEFCAKRVFFLLGMNADVFAMAPEQSKGEAYLLRLVRSDARMSGRVLRMLLSLIIPCITFLVALSVLLYLDAKITLIIGFLGFIFLFYQYKVSKKAVEQSMLFEKMAPEAGKELKGVIQHCKQQSFPDENRELVERTFARGPVKKQLDSFECRIRTMEDSRLVSGLFMAMIVGLIILVMGGAIIREGAGWGRLLVYVVALRFAMVNLQATFTTLTGINRFYPQIRRNYLFVRSFEQQNGDLSNPLDEYELALDDKSSFQLEGTFQQMKVRPGLCLAFITPLELNRYTMADILRAMLGTHGTQFAKALHWTRFATSRHSCPNGSLRQILGLAEDADWSDLPLSEKYITRLREVLPKKLDKSISLARWENIEPEVKFILSCISGLNSDCQWLLVEEKGLSLLDTETQSSLLADRDDKIIVIVYRGRLGQVGNYKEEAVAVMDDNALVGLGRLEWFSSVRHQVRRVIQSLSKDRQAFAQGHMEEEDLDEM